MQICSLIKLSLNDYPGKMACTLFTGGCNLRCPFCHNGPLVLENPAPEVTEEEFFAFLKKRSGILDGVCISGGEPLLQPDIEAFIRKVKDLGYAVKLDTNGTLPDKLIALCEAGLIDYVAMDIKNTKEKYAMTVGFESFNLTNVEKSVDYLLLGKVDYEFRTTLVREFHTPQDIVGIGQWISGAKRYFMTPFRDGETVIQSGLHAPENADLEAFSAAAAPWVDEVHFRGV